MVEFQGKKYYTHEEFKDFLFKITEKAKADFKKEIKELDDLREKIYA